MEHLLVFTGDGAVKDFLGDYSQYRQYMLDVAAQKTAQERAEKPRPAAARETRQPERRKMTFKEKQEFEQLEADLAALGAEKSRLEAELSSGTLPYDRLLAASERIVDINALLDEKELRWLELSELA